MTTVLVHGGGLGKDCWNPMLPFLDGHVLAIDLPGRGDRPADLSKVGIADFVDAVVDDLESHDLHDVVLIGHSLAGITIPQVAARPRRAALDDLNAAVREIVTNQVQDYDTSGEPTS